MEIDREFFIDNLLICWTGLAPWEFKFPFPGSLVSAFLGMDTSNLGMRQYLTRLLRGRGTSQGQRWCRRDPCGCRMPHHIRNFRQTDSLKPITNHYRLIDVISRRLTCQLRGFPQPKTEPPKSLELKSNPENRRGSTIGWRHATSARVSSTSL